MAPPSGEPSSDSNSGGPITIAPMQIMSQKYSIRLFLYGGGGDSPLLDLLGFAAGKNIVTLDKTTYRFKSATSTLSTV